MTNYEMTGRQKMDGDKKKDRQREARHAARAAEICVRCRKHPATPGMAECEICREKGRAYIRHRRMQRSKESRCILCGRPLSPDDIEKWNLTCASCIARVGERNRKRRPPKATGGRTVSLASEQKGDKQWNLIYQKG